MQKMIEWYLNFYPTSGVPPKRRIVIHLTYWIVWGLFSVLAFIAPSSMGHKLIITLFIMLQGINVYYGLTYFVFPNLFSAKRFIIGLLVLFIVYCLNYALSLEFYHLVLKYTLYTKNGNAYRYANAFTQKGLWGMFNPQNIFYELNMVLSVISLPFMIKLSRVITDYSMRVARLTKEKTDLEIDFLRTQLNPHFLLNSLNNIYSQVVSKDETAGDSIIVLSDLMKYILYNSGELLVDLDREIHFLRDYVDLERLRGNRYLKIQFSQEGAMKGYNIAPLILINYVENAFKHGGIPYGDTLLIDIDIKFIDETLYFRIENDFVDKIDSGKKNKDGGVGIINTKKRLKLLYPDRHSLIIKNDNHKFCVEIMIKLKKE
ncbi:sensor histidine kinase [Arcicella aurantiaca]|nr:histidine kinase [Arcicella aurantiaca]